MPRFPSCCALFVATLLRCGLARADPYHQQTLPLGQRAVGMAGAFTAVADDPSATYYNPAGLVLTNDLALSASLTLQAFDRSTVAGGYRTNVGKASLNHSTGTSLPTFISAIKLLGRHGDDGRRRHAVGLSTFTVSQRDVSYDVETRGPTTTLPRLETLQVKHTERTVWYGASYAYRVNERISLGLSNFFSLSRSSYSEARLSADEGALNPDGSSASDNNSFDGRDGKTNVKSLLWRIGVLYAYSPRLQFGLMVQTASVHLRGTASVRDRSLITHGATAPVSSVFNQSESHLTSHNPTPWEVRLGSRYALYSWLTLAIDAALYGPSGSKSRPVVTIGPRSVDPETNAAPQIGALQTDSYYRHWNGNVSIGASAVLPRTVRLRAGLYTDLSSAPRIPSSSARYYDPDVHRIGATVAVGLQSEGFDIALGMIGLAGLGHAMAFNTDPDLDQRYQRTRATDRMFLLFVNGVKSAISTLAKHAETGLMKIKGKLADEPEPRDEPASSSPEQATE
ncbi:MAG TPA: outer membrane protein transport protein [Polyangiales bacterium]|nr:outer membrane protein transport protein [Polyangiales bacterium]